MIIFDLHLVIHIITNVMLHIEINYPLSLFLPLYYSIFKYSIVSPSTNFIYIIIYVVHI